MIPFCGGRLAAGCQAHGGTLALRGRRPGGAHTHPHMAHKARRQPKGAVLGQGPMYRGEGQGYGCPGTPLSCRLRKCRDGKIYGPCRQAASTPSNFHLSREPARPTAPCGCPPTGSERSPLGSDRIGLIPPAVANRSFPTSANCKPCGG